MKLLLRIAAGLSFGLCFIGGFWIFCVAALRLNVASDAAPIAALGLVLMGAAVFAGAMIWLLAEKCFGRRDDKGGQNENNTR